MNIQMCGFINSLTYAELCLGTQETTNHKNDEAPAGVELTLCWGNSQHAYK